MDRPGRISADCVGQMTANTYRIEAQLRKIVDDKSQLVWMVMREGIPSAKRAVELEDEVSGHNGDATRVVCEQTDEVL